MSNNRDDFRKSTIDTLARRAAFICSNPECRSLTIAPSPQDEDKYIYTGIAAHITAASEGGPRYNLDLTTEERKSIKNGVFLCNNCAEMIDKNNGIDFPASKLEKWKSEHEVWVHENLNKRIDVEGEQNQIFYVSSSQQKGGITAGIVNIGPKPRSLSSTMRSQLLEFLTDKSEVVTITCVMGDSESFSFASEIKEYLAKSGYKINGVNQAIFSKPIKGQEFNPDTLTIRIGSRQ